MGVQDAAVVAVASAAVATVVVVPVLVDREAFVALVPDRVEAFVAPADTAAFVPADTAASVPAVDGVFVPAVEGVFAPADYSDDRVGVSSVVYWA